VNGAPSLRRITPADHRIMPWKNGLGVTREIAIDPPGASMSDAGFRWRLSIATVDQSGPFSSFPGIDRTIMVIDGKGMELTVAGQAAQRLDRCFVPFSFPGDAKTECELIDGPIRDFNLMVSRKHLTARTTVCRWPDAARLAMDAPIAILHLLEGDAGFTALTQHVQGAAGDTLLWQGSSQSPQVIEIAPRGSVTIPVMELTPVR
jgi:environmental stress-induced protein Ves